MNTFKCILKKIKPMKEKKSPPHMNTNFKYYFIIISFKGKTLKGRVQTNNPPVGLVWIFSLNDTST